MLGLWMFISFDSKRNEPKKTAGCALFYERLCFSNASSCRTGQGRFFLASLGLLLFLLQIKIL
jgi:hypothetical protein